jgi:hypothetical protein
MHREREQRTGTDNMDREQKHITRTAKPKEAQNRRRKQSRKSQRRGAENRRDNRIREYLQRT